ncbi:hypothetical protein M0R45_004817 [Rubus argutus]|uniref:Secreted protein n=1 Tax=Rubus argutus TaxID=59490 RepID=A0AAW1YL17_RUBAR
MALAALFLALAAALVQSDGEDGPIIGHKYFVRLVNNVNDLSVLHYTCGSNSDIIGPRELASSQCSMGIRISLQPRFNVFRMRCVVPGYQRESESVGWVCCV